MWHTYQIDYVITFPQATSERKIHTENPKGFQIKDGNSKEYVLKLHRKIYGKNQSGRVWYTYLTNILVNKVGFNQSKVGRCVFYQGNVMYVLYNDDSIYQVPIQTMSARL